jgi:NAD(P)-dependent dehydrogenase (short-subunit alcohol dehydrogenase family)
LAGTDQTIAVVTGASRGLGRGVARALGSKGAVVYVTGRASGAEGALERTADEITASGGQGLVAVCDHADDDQVEAFFERIRAEHGRVDILVNNAAAVHPELNAPGAFWEKPLHLVDMIDVGLRSSYVASYYAAPLMVPHRRGVIAHVSFYGAVSYFRGAAYGAAKAGCDKMAHDMAVDLRPHDVACVSIWPGYIRTERVEALSPDSTPPEMADHLANFETPDFTGLVVHALYKASDRMNLSGRALIGAELGLRYGIIDLNGRQPPSYRDAMGAPREAFVPPA